MLIGWEIQFLQGGRQWDPVIFTISPPRTGSVEYFFWLATARQQITDWLLPVSQADPNSALFRNFRERWQDLVGGAFTARIRADRCASTKPNISFMSSSGTQPVLVLIPIDWEGMARPESFFSPPLTPVEDRGGIGGVFGDAPTMRQEQRVPRHATAKPGETISLRSRVASLDAGSTLLARLTARGGGSSSESEGQRSLNENEAIESANEITMPGLLPGERVGVRTVHAFSICPTDSPTETEEGRRDVDAAVAQELAGPIEAEGEIAPTDALLVNTQDGEFEIVGSDLSYEGVAILSDGRPKSLSGSAPKRVLLADIIALGLRMSRQVAVVEDREIISEGDDQYLYSAVPTPAFVVKAAKWGLTNLRPAVGHGGLIVPKRIAPVARLRPNVSRNGRSNRQEPAKQTAAI